MNTTYTERSRNIFFIALLVIFAALSFSVLSPFLIVLALAYVSAVLLTPVHSLIERKFKKFFKSFSSAFSAVITLVLLVTLILTPFSFILGKIVSDAQGFYTQVSQNGGGALTAQVEQFIQRYVPSLDINLDEAAASISSFVVDNLGTFFTGTFDFILKLFLFLIALFYFLKDREHFGKLYKRISPINDTDNEKILTSVRQASRSILIGSLVVALTQGVVTGIGFTIFGVPNPFFWGAVAGLFALVPGVGPALIWIPASLYLYLTGGGESVAWIGQIVWGVVAVGLIDNILGPQVINKGVQIHPLFILLSVIGGIAMFGPEGFIFGPLILSTLVATLDVWKFKKN